MEREPALFDAAREPEPRTRRLAADAAETDPVARVWVEAQVPQLDRVFEYIVPETLSSDAIPGAKVRVVLGGQQVNGWIVSREAEPETEHALRPLKRVLSPHPIMTPELLGFLTTVAHRQMGLVSDLMRLAVPPRVAGVDSAFQPQTARLPLGRVRPEPWALPEPGALESTDLRSFPDGQAFLASLASGGSPRAVAVLPRAQATCLIGAVEACVRSGRRAVVVVPDHRRLQELDAALSEALGTHAASGSEDALFARLSADDPPTLRYRSYLRAVYQDVDVVIGTRAAAYAPLRGVGLVALWDDGDASLLERRAPYAHVRDVLVAKAVEAGAAFLCAGQTPTSEGLRLTEIGWARLLEHRPGPGGRPRVVASGSEFEAARDRLAQAARIPSVAFQAARRSLERGPVLVHVARAGYSPVVKCSSCFERALCPTCQGPLVVTASAGEKRFECSWCARRPEGLECSHCGGTRFYQPVAGALRTAEELGRAFPGVRVVSSSGSSIREEVPDESALVVATPGAEPRVLAAGGAEAGYAGALILDAEASLARDSLHALEEALRRWFRVMALVRPDGDVVATVQETAALNALVSYDPTPAILRDVRQRAELGLPPSVRAVTLTGSEAGVAEFWGRVRRELDADGPLAREPRVIGPAPAPVEPADDPGEDALWRLLVLFGYQDAPRVSAAVRARRLLDATAHKRERIRVRCDPPEIL
ncbi:primosomal protein N' [Falsarthrobacter nasiphocae]|uniref:Probable replication restart protein PriA n=1 Tax=Falsarthrobacter nasiphocae TaxID=189863 RepID=A0AAE3YGG3_9MICC|nr:primosomal protein N' [Falsarthrobacter nasiphocae]MDR6892994.1 primosomal protein N' (replication factor Y) [Falsarthrobacter nasiphocae]